MQYTAIRVTTDTTAVAAAVCRVTVTAITIIIIIIHKDKLAQAPIQPLIRIQITNIVT